MKLQFKQLVGNKSKLIFLTDFLQMVYWSCPKKNTPIWNIIAPHLKMFNPEDKLIIFNIKLA